MAHGDFNNDGRSGIVVAYDGSDNVNIVLTYDIGFLTNSMTYSTGSAPLLVAVCDFNNDTILDIIVANYGSNNLGIFLGHGDGTFVGMTLIPLEYRSHTFMVLVGDLNNDRKLDFAVAHNGTDSLHIFLQTC